MKHIAPQYYSSFRCSADRCRHSCCVGWEIDIDEGTAAFYQAVDGTLGERLAANMMRTDDGCSFRLDDKDRCPFLNASGLCDIILTLGDEALCQICADHPRFRNYLSDRVEIGLGLCCEEAARVMLTSESDDLVVLEDDGESIALDTEEAMLLSKREALFAIARDRKLSIREREQAILARVGRPPLCAEELYHRLAPLERLEEDWSEVLTMLPTASDTAPPHELVQAFERLLVYFLYRHLADSLEDDRLEARAAFAAHSVKVLRLLCTASGNTLEALIDLSRRYSSEIEYSDENIDALLEAF